jgi:type II secretion system protein D
MTRQTAIRHLFRTSILSLCLGLALPAVAQQRGGNFGGGGFGGANRGNTGRSGTSSGNTSTMRQYPNNTTIGDAYFTIDPETHRIVYIADEATARYISQVLTNLDRPKPQVLIKVAFIEVARGDGLDFGVDAAFRATTGYSPSTTMVTNYSLINGGTTSNAIVPSFLGPITSYLPSSFLTGTNISGLAGLNGAGTGLYQILGQDYMVTLHAIATAGKAKILSRPSIVARNNQPATIQVGKQVPLITGVNYDSLGNTHNSYQYTPVGVILKVTPFITEDGLVTLMLSPQISQIDPTLQIPISTSANGLTTLNAPVIDIRSADTVVVTPDGQTVVIGGLIQNTKSEAESKVPFLGDIPLLGSLFKRKVTQEDKNELMIFLTPHIIPIPTEMAALSTTERSRSDAIKSLSDKELDKFLDTLPMKEDPKVKKKPAKSKPIAPPGSN